MLSKSWPNSNAAAPQKQALFRLPPRPQLGFVGSFYTFSGGAVAVAAMYWMCSASIHADVIPWIVQMGLSLALLPVSLIPVFYGLWMLVGYDQVEIGRGTLTATRRLWGFGWPRRRNLADLKTLCVACFRSKYAAPNCTLYADSGHGLPLTLATAYPEQVILRLADDLATRCAQEMERSGAAGASLPVARLDLDAIKTYYANRPYVKVATGGILISILGLALITIGVPGWMADAASRQWPSAPGRIIESAVVTAQHPKAGATNQLQTYYGPRVKYRYTVAGREFEGERLHYGIESSEREKREFADKILEHYPVNKPVSVFYCPRSPGTAVLEPGQGVVGYAILTVLGVGFLLCGLPVIAWYFYRASLPHNHVIYQGGISYDPQHPGGIRSAMTAYLQSESLVAVLLVMPVMLMLLVVIVVLAVYTLG